MFFFSHARSSIISGDLEILVVVVGGGGGVVVVVVVGHPKGVTRVFACVSLSVSLSVRMSHFLVGRVRIVKT